MQLHQSLQLSNTSSTVQDYQCAQQAVSEATTICHRPLQVDLLTLKVVSESRVTWDTSVPILVFLGLSVLDLCPMYATDRRQPSSDIRRASSLNASALSGRGIIINPWKPVDLLLLPLLLLQLLSCCCYCYLYYMYLWFLFYQPIF